MLSNIQIGKIKIDVLKVDNNCVHYLIKEDKGVDLLQNQEQEIYIKYDAFDPNLCDLSEIPVSILLVPITLYILPITYFYNIELVVPSIDSELYKRLPSIYEAYSKIYGPFKKEWRGQLTVKKVVVNPQVKKSRYDKIVFFSGGVDAIQAGLNNPGKKTLLVSIPDIEKDALKYGPLRQEKFTLLKNFSGVVNSNWVMVSNNLNSNLFIEPKIHHWLNAERKLNSDAFRFDGWRGIIYLANMCSIAPLAYKLGIKSLIMGSSFEQIEDKLLSNNDGASPVLSNSIGFSDVIFGEQDSLTVRRSKKVRNIIEWCKSRGKKTKLWVCFNNSDKQCGYCVKCVRTQLNILCANENPRDWGFDNFNEKEFSKYVKSFRYLESNPCWIWDNVETIKDNYDYSYCNDLLHWLRKIGYKSYYSKTKNQTKVSVYKKLISFNRYPHYIKVLLHKI